MNIIRITAPRARRVVRSATSWMGAMLLPFTLIGALGAATLTAAVESPAPSNSALACADEAPGVDAPGVAQNTQDQCETEA